MTFMDWLDWHDAQRVESDRLACERGEIKCEDCCYDDCIERGTEDD